MFKLLAERNKESEFKQQSGGGGGCGVGRELKHNTSPFIADTLI